jgi:hypothetical protein
MIPMTVVDYASVGCKRINRNVENGVHGEILLVAKEWQRNGNASSSSTILHNVFVVDGKNV